jgi:trehalose-phosphatase
VETVYDASVEVASRILKRTSGRHLLVLTDYDGTLSELAPTPSEAVVADVVRDEMARLAALSTVTFGVISGRAIADVRPRVGAAAEYLGGLHGLEIEGPGMGFRHRALDEVAPIIDRIARTASRELTWCPGIYFENKTYALTCHVRLSPPDLAERALEAFAGMVEPYLERNVLKTMAGAKALELLPSVDWHKGRAVDWIRRQVDAAIGATVPVVYLGDDRTDEDAFAGLHGGDSAVGVGPRPRRDVIEWRLAGPASVGRLFGHLRRSLGGDDVR